MSFLELKSIKKQVWFRKTQLGCAFVIILRTSTNLKLSCN